MALPVSIHSLLSGREVEWARIEFKTTWDPAASLKTICAFANDLDNWGGGYIVLGVEEENGIPVRPLVGVPLDKADDWQKSIFKKCKLISPDYMPIIGKEEYEGKIFIVIWCPGGYGRPYSSPKTMDRNNKEKICYIRKGSITAEPTDDELKELYSLSNRTPYDDQVNHTAELSDLNFTLIKSYLKEIGSDLYGMADHMDFTELCRSMHLISELPEYIKPRNVALMFFNSEPDKYFPYAQIDVVQFPEGEGGDQIIEQTFKGPLHEQLRAALRYIRNVIITEKVVKYPDRAEADRFFNYPYAAIEEALANAVYHKAYDEREPIEVRVNHDMIEIISHPGPDRSVTLQGLKEYNVYSRRYRNRRIGEFLKDLHLTEGRNTGFKKILKAIRTNGSPLPEFETDEAHDYFVTRLFVHERFYEEQKVGDLGEKSEVGTEKVGGLGEKSAVGTEKVGDLDEKSRMQKIEISVVNSLATRRGYSKPTIDSIQLLYYKVDTNQLFSAKYVREVLECADSTARSIIGKLRDMDVVVPVSGHGKGVYRFRNKSEK